MTTKKKEPVKDRFCEEFGITRKQLKVLTKKVDAAAKAQEDPRTHTDEKRAEKLCNQVEEYAKAIGFVEVDWRVGLYPRFLKGEKYTMLPE